MLSIPVGFCVLAVGAQGSVTQRGRRRQACSCRVAPQGVGTALRISTVPQGRERENAVRLAVFADRKFRRQFAIRALSETEKVALAVPDVAAEAAKRLLRLELLVQLGRLYQKFVHAERLLSDKSPFARKRDRENGDDGSADGDSNEGGPEELMIMVKEIEELQETAAKIQAIYTWNGFPEKVAELFDNGGSKNGDQKVDDAEAGTVLRNMVEQEFQRLTARAAACLAALPYSSVEEARLSAEYDYLRQKQESAEADSSSLVPRLSKGVGERVERLGERVEQLGKEAKRTEAKLEEGWGVVKERPLSALRDAASWGQGVWVRLNGGGRSMRKGAAAVLDVLPIARALKQDHDARMVSLSLETEEADNRLAEASKARETRLRKRDSTRTLLAQDIGELDAAVRKARVTLAVCQMAVEMERLYFALEEEALEAGQDAAESPMGARSNDELSIFVAEFGALEAALARARTLALRDQVLILSDEELDDLARNTRDLTTRLGLSEDGGDGAGLSVGMVVEKSARGVRDAVGKVREGAGFLARGVRMLGTDMSSSARIFARAILGSTLKPREVQTLRRTSLDVLSFVPFTVILLAPISPVGHVLVFSFIQKYFPGFFPSQFTTKRQELFQKFEELNAKLAAAEAAATEETLAAALKRAQEVVEALTREGSVDTRKLDMLASLESEEALRDVYPNVEEKLQKRLKETSEQKRW